MRQNIVMRDVSNSQDGVSKISRSRSKNNVSAMNKLKEKEQGWNDRFHLEQIPEYNYHNEPFAQYLKNKGRIPKSEKIDFAGGKPRKNRQYREGSLEKSKVTNKPNPSRVMERFTQAIKKAFTDLKNLWKDKNIPEQHMEVMTKILSKENNPMKVLQDIKLEFSQIEKQNSFVQKILPAVQPREECVNKIKEICQKAEKQGNPNRNEFEELLQHYRILSIHCVECIYQWRKNLEMKFGKSLPIEYKFEGESYYEKMKNDYKEITKSKFSEIYSFPDKNDIFFTNITLNGKKLLPVSKPFMKRIKMCETVINQEPPETPSALQSKSPAKGGKSLPPVPHQTGQSFTKISVQYSTFTDYFNNMKGKSPYDKSLWSCLDHTKYQEYTVLSFDKTGQVILAVDRNSSQRKIVLMVLTCQTQDLQKFLKQTCKYIWDNDQCTEIRIGLYHLTSPNGTMGVDKDFQNVLNTIGFRWLCVSNNGDLRITMFGTKRPLNTLSIYNHQFYPVIVEHFTSYSKSDLSKKIPSCSYLSILTILKLIMDRKDEHSEEISKNEDMHHYLSQLPTIQQFSYSGLRSFAINTQEDFEKITHELLVKPEVKIPTFMSILNVSFKFKNNYIIDDKYMKLFPSKDVEIVICQSSHPIYLLQTDEENINIFIFQVEQNFKTDQIESVFNAMGDQSSYIDDFWLPTFKRTAKYTDEVGFTNEMVLSTDYKTKLNSLTRRSKTKAKIIKPPFVFGLINKELLSLLEVPFFCTLVTKEDLV